MWICTSCVKKKKLFASHAYNAKKKKYICPIILAFSFLATPPPPPPPPKQKIVPELAAYPTFESDPAGRQPNSYLLEWKTHSHTEITEFSLRSVSLLFLLLLLLFLLPIST